MRLIFFRRPIHGRVSATLLACAAIASAAAVTAAATAATALGGHDDAYVYRLPYGSGVGYPVLQGYGSRFSHRGTEFYTVDFRMGIGTPVFSAREGIVIEVESSHIEACWSEGCGALANRVIVRHADGSYAKYFHLAQGSVVVRPGQRVGRGQLLARSGNTGLTTTPHLHFGVYVEIAGGEMQSIPVRFDTQGGPTEPRPGRRYMHPVHAHIIPAAASTS